MARPPRPWWWSREKKWCTTVGGVRHVLGPHPPGCPPPRKSPRTGLWNAPDSIQAALGRLAGPEAASPSQEALECVLDDFLVWCLEHREPATARRYRFFLQDVVLFRDGGAPLGKEAALDLSPRQLTAWLASKTGWGPTTKHNALVAVNRALNWAVKNRGLARNPVRGMERPRPRARRGLVTPEEFDRVLAAVGDRRFRDLLVVSYDSGARPQEVKAVEARHVQAGLCRAVFPAEESKGGRPRVVYFPTARCMEVVARLCGQHPDGPVFRNSRGEAWTAQAVYQRFRRLEAALGRRVRHYEFRRGFITRKIVAGVDSHVVATLAGHTSTAMIDRHYSAVAADHEFLLRQAARDVSPAAAPAAAGLPAAPPAGA